MRNVDAAIHREACDATLLNRVVREVVETDSLGCLGRNRVKLPSQAIVDRELTAHLPLVVHVDGVLPGAFGERVDVLNVVPESGGLSEKEIGYRIERVRPGSAVQCRGVSGKRKYRRPDLKVVLMLTDDIGSEPDGVRSERLSGVGD